MVKIKGTPRKYIQTRVRYVQVHRHTNLDPLSQYLAMEVGAVHTRMQQQHERMRRLVERLEARTAQWIQTDAALNERTAERDDIWNQLEAANHLNEILRHQIRTQQLQIMEMRGERIQDPRHRRVMQRLVDHLRTTQEDPWEDISEGGPPTEEDLQGLDDF